MDKDSKLSSAVQSFDVKQPRRQRKEPPEPYSASSPPLVCDQISRGNRSSLSSKPAGKGGNVPKSHGYSSSRRVRETREDALQRDKSERDSQVKTSKSNMGSHAQGKIVDKNSLDAKKKGFRDARSAPNSAGKSKPAQTDSIPFEVKMSDFPELDGISPGKADPLLVQKVCWGPATTFPRTQTQSPTGKFGIRGSSAQPVLQHNAKRDSSTALLGQSMVVSWANVASQPPKKIVPESKTINGNQKSEVMSTQQEAGVSGKKKRKKKKKAKGACEDVEVGSEELKMNREPPKFEDEEEFPGLPLTLTGNNGLITSHNAKICNEENQREGGQHESAHQNKAKPLSTETTKKGQKAEKVSGKKSKVPVQLDIGNMLAALEKKQQSLKPKQDAKPVILSIGGGLSVVQKQPSVQKKPPWQQDKIAHNPLDSTSPLVKKGKQREVPKAKKPTPLKKVILKEREERKQRRLLEERGLLPENELKPSDAAEEEQCDTNDTDEVGSPTEDPDDESEFIGTTLMIKEENEEADKEETTGHQTTSAVPCPVNQPKIHSRKFRDYCSQMLSRDVDQCVTALLKELVRFQDRLYQKDPMKARMKRRIVMGLREVLKHLRLRKVKCVIISPNCERIQSKGGLDEALHTIIDTCRDQGVPFVFALSRKALGRCVNKAVPVSLVGIFNYDGAQDYYHMMIELSSEARRAYEEMLSSLELTDQAESETVDTEDELHISSLAEEADPSPDTTQLEEPEYIKVWKKMLEKDYNHKFFNFEEQLRSMHLASECTENTEDEKT